MPHSHARLSPTEVVALFADRILPSTHPDSWIGWRVVRSHRKVAVKGFAILALDTLVGALVAAEAVELRLLQRKGLLKSYEVAQLHLLQGVKASVFPHQSPEARMIDWLARQEGRAGWLDEAIIGTLIPEESPRPARRWNHELHRGLVARRLAREITRTFLRVFVNTSHDLLPASAGALERLPESALVSALADRARVTTHERTRCRQAWKHATQLRYVDTSST